MTDSTQSKEIVKAIDMNKIGVSLAGHLVHY